jgi:hypothetical protein
MREQLSLFEDHQNVDNDKVKHLKNLRHLNEARRILASTPSYEEKLRLNRLTASISRGDRQIAS